MSRLLLCRVVTARLITAAAIVSGLFFGSAGNAPADNSDVFSIRLSKSATFFQFGPDSFLLDPILYEGQARIFADSPGSILSAAFAPSGFLFRGMQSDAFGDFYFSQGFVSASDWHAAFPSGTYQFELQTATPPTQYTAFLPLSDRYPSVVPQILNNWYSIVVQLDSTSDFTLQWNDFPDFDFSFDQPSAIRFEILSVFDEIVFEDEFFDPRTEIVLPADTLEAGQIYLGRLFFAHSQYAEDPFTFFESFSAVATAFLISAVDGPPVILPPLDVSVTVGQLFAYVITATNLPGEFSASNLPPGIVTFDLFGVIGGYPTTPGTYQIPISASNSLGTGANILTLTVQPAAALTITSSTKAAGAKGRPFSYQVVAPGATSAARLSTTGLPSGLTADPVSGEISGTPTQSGNFAVTLTVTDQNATATALLDLSFNDDPAFPSIISADTVTISPGQNFTYQIVAPVDDSKASSDPTEFTIIGNLPAGLSFDPKTGIISGTYTGNPLKDGDPPDKPKLSGGALLGNIQLFANNSRGTATIPLAFFSAPTGAVNISTRMAVGTGQNVLIGGFIVTGNAPKQLLIRATGPSLTAGGIAGALQDPLLELRGEGGVLLGSNDNWRTDQEQDILNTTIPPSDDRESAILAAFPPGPYTAIVQGKDGGTGIGLVELYDLGTASLETSSTAKLGNISTRGTVLGGDNVMIGGFIISSNASKVIVRAIGPSLTQFGISDALSDPTLELVNSDGSRFALNDDWRTSQEQQIINTGVPPTDDRESAIFVEALNPGSYTAIVRGKNGATGVGVVEVYALD